MFLLIVEYVDRVDLLSVLRENRDKWHFDTPCEEIKPD
jgi:hypothetical protein